MHVSFTSRTFHFKQPARTSRGVYTERRSWFVSVADGNFCGVGECAPLPDLSCEAGDGYEDSLAEACRRLETTGQLDAEALRHCPSILFGLETALLSLQGARRGDAFCLFNTPFSRGQAGIRINGLVWMGSLEQMLERMEQKLEQGFGCVKLKIGALDFDSELSMIASLRRRFAPTTVEIRVDANGGFAPNVAARRLEALAPFGIHSIEQPIRAGQWADMARLCANTPVPIALDEELIGIFSPDEKQQMLNEVRPQYVVLKPSLHGGLTGCREWISLADKLGMGYWVTSALESNVGLNAIAQWTASLQAGRTANDAFCQMHQGLGTGALFTDNTDEVRLTIKGEELWREQA